MPHRFRIEWRPSSVEFYADGVRVAVHTQTDPIDGPLRPVFSDYGLFGAAARVDWVRMGSYAPSGTMTSRVLDSGPGANQWQTLTSQRTLPTGSGIAFETRSGGTSKPDASWSAWQPVGAGGAIASPAARFIQYRANLTEHDVRDPDARAGADHLRSREPTQPPQQGTVAITPTAPRTSQTVTATPSGFTDADGDPLTYHYQWLRNGTEIAGATTSSLDLSTPGAGDRGDKVRVEVYATDGRGAASDAAVQTVTVANTRAHGRNREHQARLAIDERRPQGSSSRIRGRRRRRPDVCLPVVPERHPDRRRHGSYARPLSARQRRSRRPHRRST